MAFATFEVGDVYVLEHADGYLTCHACRLRSQFGDARFNTAFTSVMVEHLRAHAKNGHRIPDGLIPALLLKATELDASTKARRRRTGLGVPAD